MTLKVPDVLAAIIVAACIPAAVLAGGGDAFLPFAAQARALAHAADCHPDRMDDLDGQPSTWRCVIGRLDDPQTFMIQLAADPTRPGSVSHIDIHWADGSGDRGFERRAVVALKSVLSSLSAPSMEFAASAFMGRLPAAAPGRWASRESQFAGGDRGLRIDVTLVGNATMVQRRIRIGRVATTGLAK